MDNQHRQFGIDEIYFHKGLDYALLKKLQQRACITLDSTDNIILKYATYDSILIFYSQFPSPSLIYKFLKFLHQNPQKEIYVTSNTLLNEDEMFDVIKSKTFALVTYRDISNS
jgi:hypothetical protein